MLKSISSLTGSGVKDWIIQRVTAIYLAVYIIWFLILLISHGTHGSLSFNQWFQIFYGESYSTWFRVASFVAILAMILHAWVGVWTIMTDYIHCPVTRSILQVCLLFAMFACGFWGLRILWGY